ncbi:uncharacterized protein LOC116119326 [Pistacia vera]|uniref:uncharacterized protein LOC116119326 n=1 Tax=Pistacia vera TaxID=55513 RepID=UPI001263846B|nr:uncharacterized protein LOC116119326 [Pistacia vera]
MANQQESENSTVMDYPVNPKKPQPLLPVSWPRSTAATTATDHSKHNCPEDQNANNNKRWKDLSCKKKVVIVASSVGLLLLASILVYFAIFIHGRFHPPSFKVDSLRVTPFDISSSQLTTNWDINFSITNPNHQPLRLFYRDVKVSVFYEDKNISSAEIKPFFLNLNGKPIFGYSKSIVNGSMEQDFVANWSSDGLILQDSVIDLSSSPVKFTLTVDATVFVNPQTPKELEIIPVTVSCEDIKVEFSSDSKSSAWTMLNHTNKCKSKWVPDRFLY